MSEWSTCHRSDRAYPCRRRGTKLLPTKDHADADVAADDHVSLDLLHTQACEDLWLAWNLATTDSDSNISTIVFLLLMHLNYYHTIITEALEIGCSIKEPSLLLYSAYTVLTVD